LSEQFQLGLAAHERGETARHRSLQPRADHARTEKLTHVDRRGQPFHRTLAQRLGHDVALGEIHRAGRQEDRARQRHLLHARREIHGLAECGVVHAQVVADGTDHHVAGIQADTDLDHYALRPVDMLGMLLDFRLHAKRRVAGAHGVILVRDRRAEDRHEAVAHGVTDGPLVVVDGIHHELEDWIEDGLRLLGIAVSDELGRALQVRKEHRHMLALAFDGVARRQDLLDEMLGRVGCRRGQTLGRRLPALGAELRGRGYSRTAAAAGARQRRGAFFAEFCLRCVLVLAARTGDTHRHRITRLPGHSRHSDPVAIRGKASQRKRVVDQPMASRSLGTSESSRDNGKSLRRPCFSAAAALKHGRAGKGPPRSGRGE
jgi:hypothetical protein